jgi:hypothetical protein
MRFYRKFFCIFSFALSAFCGTTQAQIDTKDSSELFVITLNDGTELFGTIVQTTDSTYTLMTESIGQITIAKSKIKEIGLFLLTEGNRRNYAYMSTLMQTAMPMKKKTFMWQSYYLLVNEFGAAFTDHISMHIGTAFLPYIAEPGFFNGYLRLRYAMTINPRLHYAVGYTSLFVRDPFDRTTNRGSVLLHSMTYGTLRKHFTLGGGIVMSRFRPVNSAVNAALYLEMHEEGKFAFISELNLVPTNEPDLDGINRFYTIGGQWNFHRMGLQIFNLGFFGEQPRIIPGLTLRATF